MGVEPIVDVSERALGELDRQHHRGAGSDRSPPFAVRHHVDGVDMAPNDPNPCRVIRMASGQIPQCPDPMDTSRICHGAFSDLDAELGQQLASFVTVVADLERDERGPQIGGRIRPRSQPMFASELVRDLMTDVFAVCEISHVTVPVQWLALARSQAVGAHRTALPLVRGRRY